MSDVTARQAMIAGLDRALHGHTTARDQTPEKVWHDLLQEVEALAQKKDSPCDPVDRAFGLLTGLLGSIRNANR